MDIYDFLKELERAGIVPDKDPVSMVSTIEATSDGMTIKWHDPGFWDVNGKPWSVLRDGADYPTSRATLEEALGKDLKRLAKEWQDMGFVATFDTFAGIAMGLRLEVPQSANNAANRKLLRNFCTKHGGYYWKSKGIQYGRLSSSNE